MADAQRRVVFRERTPSHDALVEEIVPSSTWTEDSEGRYLLVDLLGFKKEEVKLQMDDSGNISVGGERLVKDSKLIIFEQTFKIPVNSDAEQITGKFNGRILYVTVPKLPTNKKEKQARSSNTDSIAKEENDEAKNAEKLNKEGQVDHHGGDQMKEKKAKEVYHHHKDGFPREVVEKWGSQEDNDLMAFAMEMVKQHNVIVITAALAFSLGCFVGRKL